MYYEKQKGVVIDCDVCLFLNKQNLLLKKVRRNSNEKVSLRLGEV